MYRSTIHILFRHLLIAFLFSWVIVYPTVVVSQTVYTDQELLQAAVRNHEANLGNLNAYQDLTLPEKQWIDQMEFRTEFNELDLSEQEYTFRMRFRNDNVRKLENELLLMKQSLLEKEIKGKIDDGAIKVYKQIVALHFNQELDSLIKYKLDLLKDKNSVSTTLMLSDESIDFNDALKIKERQYEIKQELYDINWQKESILVKLGITDKNVFLKVRNLIAIESLSEVTQNALILKDLHPDLSNFETRMNILEKERELEEEDTQTLLRFAQLRYQSDNDFTFERELSLGLGFNLPYRKVNKLNLAKLELDQIKQSLEKQEILIDISLETEEEINELMTLINKHKYLVELFEEENLSQLKAAYMGSDRVEALPLINLELMIIDRQIDLLISRQEIYLQYITALDRTGALQFDKNTNWLDQSLRPIE